MSRFCLRPSLSATMALCAVGLAACTMPAFGPTSPSEEAAPAPELPASIRAEEIVGRWGYAAYHNPSDRPRIEAAAKGQCNKPVVITRGPTGGVMMYLADQTQLQELRLKGGPGGKNYIGPPGPPGGPQDREIVAFDGRVLLTQFTDPEVSGRYGTSVYVRCGPKA